MRGWLAVQDLLKWCDDEDRPLDFKQLMHRLADLRINANDAVHALSFDDQHYRRVSIRLRPHYEALILCWQSGQRSAIHDHTGSACAVRVVEGIATETFFSHSPCGWLYPTKSRVSPAGSVTGCDDGGIHQMANLQPAGQDLITLHIYSPPPASWQFYTVDQTSLAGHDELIERSPKTISLPLVSLESSPRPSARGISQVWSNRVEQHSHQQTVGIIGGGFCGTMVAVQLARQCGTRPLRILLFEKGSRFGRGLAYGTSRDEHLLNVPAGAMSALPSQPDDFLQWLQRGDPSANAGTFASRKKYGEYLEDLLKTTLKNSRAQLELIREEVVDVARVGTRGLRLYTRQGQTPEADQVVLALGHVLPQDPLESAEPKPRRRAYVPNPWAPGALEGIDPQDAIALIGTGLTAADLIVEASARGHRGPIYAISRHGLLPHPHRPTNALSQPPLAEVPRSARALLRSLREAAKRTDREGDDWRSVIDSIRPMTQSIWRSLDQNERARFLRHLTTKWDIHRHRVAPQIHELLTSCVEQGQLLVRSARVLAIEDDGDDVVLTLRPRGHTAVESLRVKRVINCTGPGRDIRVGSMPLLRAIQDRGLARPGPLGLGLDVTEAGALVGRDGRHDYRLLTLGPLLKEALWESTAVRELRVQAFELAQTILQQNTLAASA
jgi:uncharacterized NAD(P)/FAD-binding protein YdhS/predicted metal-dependent enzyme (double-stranded beta helix superfamily)